MHELYELRDMLCDELKEYGAKDKLDKSGLDIIDKLTHTIKNLDKIIESEGYSMAFDDRRGGSYRGRYDGGSYARGRTGNVRRDSMGRYSRDGNLVAELHELMEEAPDERTRAEFQKFISKVEQM